MTKMWADVFGFFPDTVFNAHTGPAAQMWGLDDFLAADFDSASHGFVGGATPNVENQRLPIRISREALPPDVPAGARATRTIYARGSTGPRYVSSRTRSPTETNFLDLDPRHRDRSGLGLPVVRITYDMQENEHRRLRLDGGEGRGNTARDGRDEDLARPALRRGRQQPRPRRVPHGRGPCLVCR